MCHSSTFKFIGITTFSTFYLIARCRYLITGIQYMHCIPVLHVGWTNFNFSVESPNKVICLRMRIIHIRENKISYPDLNLEKLYGTSGSVSRIDIPTLLRVSMKQNLPFFLNLINIILYYSTYLKKTKHKKPLCIMFCNSLQIFLYRPVIGSGYECGS